MSVEYDVSPTLRAQDHGHPPVVLVFDARGNGNGGGCRLLSPGIIRTVLRIIQLW